MRILQCAEFHAIEEETQRTLRTDITLIIDSKEYALEFAFHTSRGLKQYLADKITKYWKELMLRASSN